MDAVFKNGEAGIGLIVRDNKGEMEAIMIEDIPQNFDAEHAEILGFLRALEFAKDLRITHFELEGDALCVVNRINSTHSDLSMTGHKAAGIKGLIKEFPTLNISHVTRSRNRPLHAASRLALNTKCRIIFSPQNWACFALGRQTF